MLFLEIGMLEIFLEYAAGFTLYCPHNKDEGSLLRKYLHKEGFK